MLIHNYGLFWRREWVFWGRGGNAGHLKGLLWNAKTAKPVDFRNQQGIYCLYDSSFRMIYVGQAGSGRHQRLFHRLKVHTKDQLSDRWNRFSWFGIRRVNMNGTLKAENMNALSKTSDALNHIEAILISAGEPTHNLQSGRFGKQVGRYLQYRDEKNIGPELMEAVREMYEGVKETKSTVQKILGRRR